MRKSDISTYIRPCISKQNVILLIVEEINWSSGTNIHVVVKLFLFFLTPDTTNRCSVVIPHAMLNFPCGRTEGETCTYNCRYDWVPTYSSITCEQGLTWNKPLSKVCLSKYRIDNPRQRKLKFKREKNVLLGRKKKVIEGSREGSRGLLDPLHVPHF